MMKDTYLSIDLDYFDCLDNFNRNDLKRFSKLRLKLFSEIFEKKIPVKIVMRHDQMLPLINKSKCINLINLDFHSDLAGFKNPKFENLNEGTFFDYVENREEKSYLWITSKPHLLKMGSSGRCDGIDKRSKNLDIYLKKNWVYKSQKKTANIKKLNLDEVKEVGVSISKNWITDNSKPFLQDVIFPLCDKDTQKEINFACKYTL